MTPKLRRSRANWRRHPSLVLLCCVLLPSPTVNPLKPPDQDASNQLTKSLLNLDLGYNVMNQQVLRTNIGVSIDRIDRGFPAFGEEFENYDDDYDYSESARTVGGGASFFNHHQDEVLPAPQSLVRDDDYGEGGGPNPVGFWIDSSFWGSAPMWGPFGGRPLGGGNGGGGGGHISRPIRQQQRKRSRPKKKFFVGDQHQCGTGTCEFFLFCWLSGGIIEGGCGGFLFACCQRPHAVGSDVIVQRVSEDNPERCCKLYSHHSFIFTRVLLAEGK